MMAVSNAGTRTATAAGGNGIGSGRMEAAAGGDGGTWWIGAAHVGAGSHSSSSGGGAASTANDIAAHCNTSAMSAQARMEAGRKRIKNDSPKRTI